ncbi:[citrate (pro-3S)-lyase] ligase [Agathobacter sp.]
MGDYYVTQIKQSDNRSLQKVHSLLLSEGIKADKNLDYTCAIFDDDMNVIATGSSFKNTLRCFAVDKKHQGEGLLNMIASHLMEHQIELGNTHFFVYTKCETEHFFASLGFYTIEKINGQIVFMENKKNGFENYVCRLVNETDYCVSKSGSNFVPGRDENVSAARPNTRSSGLRSAAIVMNANPFTLGHRYLVSEAAKKYDLVHIFGLSDESSLIPYAVRKKLIIEGCHDFQNVIYHDSDAYMISSATFPSYFQKDDDSVITGHAMLDAHIFCRIAKRLNISSRYIGSEPKSHVTGRYNSILKQELPAFGIDCIEIPRFTIDGKCVSASDVRLAIKNDDKALLRQLVPDSTYEYFTSDMSQEVRKMISSAENVVHY